MFFGPYGLDVIEKTQTFYFSKYVLVFSITENLKQLEVLEG